MRKREGRRKGRWNGGTEEKKGREGRGLTRFSRRRGGALTKACAGSVLIVANLV